MTKRSVSMEEIEQLDFPEIIKVEEDNLSVDALEDLENKYNALLQQVYAKDSEIAELRRALREQEDMFNKVIGRALISMYGDR